LELLLVLIQGDTILRRIEIRHLRYFVAVAEELNFSRAALRLGIAQPALSRQVTSLEELLSVPLFDRSRPHIRLTGAGEVFLPRAKAVLQTMLNDVEAVRRAGSGAQGTLELGFVGSASFYVLPVLLKSFRHEFPDVSVFLTHMSMADLHEAIVNGSVHLGISRPEIDDPEVENLTLLEERLMVALPRNIPEADRSCFSIHELETRKFIWGELSIEDPIARLCASAGFTPVVAQRARDMQMMLGLVSAGLGWALLPESATRWSIPNVVFRRLEEDLITKLSLSYRRDSAVEAVAAFRELAEQSQRDLLQAN
jgi:DNA-binding transcriptional LysR family regulator